MITEPTNISPMPTVIPEPAVETVEQPEPPSGATPVSEPLDERQMMIMFEQCYRDAFDKGAKWFASGTITMLKRNPFKMACKSKKDRDVADRICKAMIADLERFIQKPVVKEEVN